MRTGTLSCNKAFTRPYSCRPLTPPASFRHQQLNFPLLSSRHANGGRRFHRLKCAAAVDRGSTESISSWDDEPYEVLPNGEIAYLDEQDVVTFLDPPKTLRPIDPSSYNPATYLWWLLLLLCFYFSISWIFVSRTVSAGCFCCQSFGRLIKCILL